MIYPFRQPKNRRHPILIELLCKSGDLHERDVEKVLDQQMNRFPRLESAVIAATQVSGERIVEVYSSYFCISTVQFDQVDFKEMEKVKNSLPESLLRKGHAVPLADYQERFLVAVSDPTNLSLVEEIRMHVRKPVSLCLASDGEVARILEAMFGERDFVSEIAAESKEDLREGEQNQTKVLNLDVRLPQSEETKVLRIVNHILKDAIRTGASDIHLEPYAESARIRFRIDGVLQELTPPPKAIFNAIISRFKILSKMDIAEKRNPQDGAFTLRTKGKEIDMRVSSVPVVWGEKIVMRLLDKDAIKVELSSLGFSPRQYEDFLAGAKSENGLVFVTGPTGSGKSTTLYATINLLKSPGTNISTVEDPVEFRVNGINQVQVKPQVGLTFAAGLRSFLRQDPDIVLVGEVRDPETASICTKAALTGHLVLSTLHTNDALSAVARLKEMEVEPFVLASTLRLVQAQRLIRRLCKECKEPYEIAKETSEKYALLPDTVVYRPKGCKVCKGLGYKGRVGIFEVVHVTSSIRDMIQKDASVLELQDEAERDGMISLGASAKEKFLEGVTSLEEILVFGQSS